MGVKQPIALNADGDWACTGCGAGIEVDESPATVRDISGADVKAVVASASIEHGDDCSVIAGIRRA